MTGTATEVWAAFGDRLKRFIAKRVPNGHDADDVLQEVFLKIQSSLDQVDGGGTLEAWLFQVTRRAVVDHFRKRRPLELTSEPEELAPAPDVSGELASCLGPLIETLDEPDREALRLADLQGLSQKELAVRFGLSLPGAKSRVQRARARLKETLLDCCRVELDRRGNALAYAPRRCACDCDEIAR